MDEQLLEAVTSLGLLRAAYGVLEKADPKCLEARALWHEAMSKLNRTIMLQWGHIDAITANSATAKAE